MSEQVRLSDFVRATLRDGQHKLSLASRAGTGRGDHFGDAQNLSLDDEETRELYELLRDHYEGDDDE